MLRKSTRLSNKPANYYTPATRSKKRASISNTEDQVKKARKQPVIPNEVQALVAVADPPVQGSLLPRKYNVEKAWNHIKSVDSVLATSMDESAYTEFQQRVSLVDGSNPFKALVTSIIFQQIHGKAAASIRNKFIRLFKAPIPFPDEPLILPSSFPWFPTPEMILSKPIEELRSAGLSQRKAEYICDLCRKFSDKTIIGEDLDGMSDEDISKLLCSVKGIGQWTVDMFLMFNLCHPDVLPVSDLGVRKGVALHFKTTKKKDKKSKEILPSPDEMRQLTDIWRPYRSLGSWMMWRIQEIKTVADD